MNHKNSTNVRAYPDDRDKLNQLSREISTIQKRTITVPEVIKRTLNIPDLPNVLKHDAEMKKRLGIK